MSRDMIPQRHFRRFPQRCDCFRMFEAGAYDLGGSCCAKGSCWGLAKKSVQAAQKLREVPDPDPQALGEDLWEGVDLPLAQSRNSRFGRDEETTAAAAAAVTATAAAAAATATATATTTNHHHPSPSTTFRHFPPTSSYHPPPTAHPPITHHHPPSPTITHHHPPSPTITHHHPPSPTTTTHRHPPSPTVTHHHPPHLFIFQSWRAGDFLCSSSAWYVSFCYRLWSWS